MKTRFLFKYGLKKKILLGISAIVILMSNFFYNTPLEKAAYMEEVRIASLERLAHLIKVCSFLMQTKAYLFWKKEKRGKVSGGASS